MPPWSVLFTAWTCMQIAQRYKITHSVGLQVVKCPLIWIGKSQASCFVASKSPPTGPGRGGGKPGTPYSSATALDILEHQARETCTLSSLPFKPKQWGSMTKMSCFLRNACLQWMLQQPIVYTVQVHTACLCMGWICGLQLQEKEEKKQSCGIALLTVLVFWTSISNCTCIARTSTSTVTPWHTSLGEKEYVGRKRYSHIEMTTQVCIFFLWHWNVAEWVLEIPSCLLANAKWQRWIGKRAIVAKDC